MPLGAFWTICSLTRLVPSRQTSPSTWHSRFCHSRKGSSLFWFLPVPVTWMDTSMYLSPRATFTEDPGRKASSAYLVMFASFWSSDTTCSVVHSARSLVSLYRSCHSLLNSDKFLRRFEWRWYQYFLFSRFTQSAYKGKKHIYISDDYYDKDPWEAAKCEWYLLTVLTEVLDHE